MIQIGFYFDQTRCTGCYACVVACKDWHDVPAGPASWQQVTTIERGEFPDLFVAFYTSSCYHCAQPACIAACPAGAITKRQEDGVVLVDQAKCLGKDQCNLCPDRLEEGKKPICVAACPMRALDAGPLDELKALYGDAREAEGFIYSAELEPSIVFKPKVKAGLAGVSM